jgi:hypothetical protein
MKQTTFLFLLVLTNLFYSSQEYKKIKLTKEELKEGIEAHYQRDATDGHFMVFDLFLYKNGRFTYCRSDNLYPEYSEGSWKTSDGRLQFRCSIQPNELPVKVSYLPVESNGKRRIAQIRNLKEDVTEAYVLINTDSINCFYGDELCNGSYDTIRRLKVGLENSDLKSAWINIKEGKETIHLVIDTELDVRKYAPFNKVFLIKREKLIEQR